MPDKHARRCAERRDSKAKAKERELVRETGPAFNWLACPELAGGTWVLSCVQVVMETVPYPPRELGVAKVGITRSHASLSKPRSASHAPVGGCCLTGRWGPAGSGSGGSPP